MIENLIGSLMKQNKFEIFSIFFNLCYKINIRLWLFTYRRKIHRIVAKSSKVNLKSGNCNISAPTRYRDAIPAYQ